MSLIALLLLQVLLVFPVRLGEAAGGAFLRLPLELPLLLLLLWLPPRRWRRPVRALLVLLLAFLLLVKLGDLVTYAGFGRPVSLLLDPAQIPHGWQWAVGAWGLPLTLLAAGGSLLALGLLVAALAWALARLQRAPGERRPATLAAALGAALLLAVCGGLQWQAARPWLSADGVKAVSEHVVAMADSLADLAEFRAAAAEDPYAAIPDDLLLAGLRGHDVLLVFVESYGRGALENPRYARVLRPTLQGFEAGLERQGFAAFSTWMTSPTLGGISWLAHGTLLSGLWVDNQQRYDSLMASRRATLVRDFARAGWRSVAVMPAITQAWPEAGFFGYDKIYGAGDLGYAGQPFNWITMPDQYTLLALQRLELEPRPRPPVMAEVALISSHMPWTPIPPLLDWDAVGDGAAFTPFATAGDPPDVVWQETDRIRTQYGLSIDYVLRTLESFVLTYGRDDLVVVIVGDHQPPPFVSENEENRDVPIHIITRDPAVRDLLAGWHWTPGLLPDADAPAWRMDELRGRLLESFTPHLKPAA